MDYKVNIKKENNYLRAEIYGKRVPGKETANMSEAWRKIGIAGRNENIYKILAILNVTGHLKKSTTLKMSLSPSEIGWSRDFKLAAVDLNRDSIDANKFSVLISGNRGYDTKLFNNETDAKAWLLDS